MESQIITIVFFIIALMAGIKLTKKIIHAAFLALAAAWIIACLTMYPQLPWL